MLTYNMDVTPESVWKRTTPSEAEMAQPYYCTEAGVFYAQQHFSTARTDKESYILFYTLRGAGLIEQDGNHVTLSTGQALLLNCRTPQSYCTAPGQSCWHHYWVHLDGAGVAAMEPLLLPGKKLTPVQLTGVKMQEYFEMLLGQMEHSTVDSMMQIGLALHGMLALCAQSSLAEAETNHQRAAGHFAGSGDHTQTLPAGTLPCRPAGRGTHEQKLFSAAVPAVYGHDTV